MPLQKSCSHLRLGQQLMAGFLVPTAHWVAEDSQGCLVLRSALIGLRGRKANTMETCWPRQYWLFLTMSALHLRLSMCCLHLLTYVAQMAYNNQVGHFSMDNAANNETCLQHLESLLHTRDIEFDICNHLIRCFSHVINLCIQHVMKSFSDFMLKDIANEWVTAFPNGADRKWCAAAVKKDPIKMVTCTNIV
jgi:hypothetical protein